MKNIWNKLFNKKKYSNDKVLLKLNKEKVKYFSLISPELDKVLKNLKTKKEISFIHYGHLGDIINCLPFIKEVSKNKKCNLFIQLKKKYLKNFV